jgi:hypothetical protein
MPSQSLGRWETTRKAELDEIASAHVAIGGTRPGRRYATQQLNHAYTLLLASHFQGFCRDLYSESVDYLVPTITPQNLQPSIREMLAQNLQLRRSNAQPGSIGADFGRFGIDFWTEVISFDKRNRARQALLDDLNTWRNAIAHQDFVQTPRGASRVLHLRRVRRWRATCEGLARTFDEVMRLHLHALTGISPW